MTDRHYPVLIVGGGPVGLALAMELGHRGIRCLLINERPSTSSHPKGSTLNSRTMEHLRRLGAAAAVRETGIPPNHVTDITYVTRFTGYELGRIEMPSSDEKLANPGPWGHTLLTPEPIHRANQLFFEPVFRDHAERYESTELRFGWRLKSFEQFADRIEATIEEVATRRTQTIVAEYMAACDGANGFVRRELGFKYVGRSSSGDKFYDGRMLSLYVRAPEIYGVMNFPVSWHYFTINTDGRTDCISLDCEGDFVVLAHIAPNIALDEIDARSLFLKTVGANIAVQILSVQEWWAGLALVVDHYQAGRIFLAGDSAHLFTPSGGFGFNTGIDDAVNLGWKLAAAVDGWGGPGLLDSYQIERMPIGSRNTTESGKLAEQIAQLKIPPNVEDDTAQGRAQRADFRKELDKFREEFASLGIQLGARYDGSPIIVGDGATPPPDDPKVYVPSSVPGGRAPHFWIDDRESLFDRLGDGYTLLCIGKRPPSAKRLESGARRRGIPFTIIDADDPRMAALYDCRLALIRPDQHVAWRGAEVPDDVDRLWRTVTGFA